MSDPTLTRNDELVVIDFGADENQTDVAWVGRMNELIDEAEAIAGPKVLITTGTGKHYSNGLDVGYMGGATSDEIVSYVGSVLRVVGRILTFPAPTVAAVNGHGFGMGAFLVLAHDHAVMREDRGFICWPEVHLQMTFHPALLAMVTNLLPPPVARAAVVTGRRYAAPDAVAAGFVDRAVPLDELMMAATELGRPHAATAGDNLGRIKRQLFAEVLDNLG